MHEVAKGVYAETSLEGCNVGCVETAHGLILIDSPMLPEDAKRWRTDVLTRTGKGIAYLITTDHHFDHILGHCFLTNQIIAQEIAAQVMESQDLCTILNMISTFFPEWYSEMETALAEVEIALPMLTLSEKLTLHMGDRTLELTHVGGHTPGTLITYLPEESVLFTGDAVVSNLHPYMGEANLREWLQALDLIETMDVHLILPGHGEVCDQRAVKKLRDFFQELTDQIRELIDAGCEKQEIIARVDLIDFFPVEEAERPRTEQMLDIGIGNIFDQLVKA